jgi:hypothetical protein
MLGENPPFTGRGLESVDMSLWTDAFCSYKSVQSVVRTDVNNGHSMLKKTFDESPL